MLEKIGIDISEMKKNDIKACKSFIADNATVLHENHFYNTDIKLALAQIIGQEIGGLPAVDDELLKEKITLCKKLNDLFCLLIPGEIVYSQMKISIATANVVPAENRVRGLLLFEMHAAVAEFGRRQGRDELLGHLVVRYFKASPSRNEKTRYFISGVEKDFKRGLSIVAIRARRPPGRENSSSSSTKSSRNQCHYKNVVQKFHDSRLRQ